MRSRKELPDLVPEVAADYGPFEGEDGTRLIKLEKKRIHSAARGRPKEQAEGQNCAGFSFIVDLQRRRRHGSRADRAKVSKDNGSVENGKPARLWARRGFDT